MLVGFKLISYLANDQIIKDIEENINTKVSIKRLEFNPFIFKVKIDGFVLKESGEKLGKKLETESKKVYIDTKQIILDVELFQSIKNKTLYINEVLIDTLNINIAQNKEEFDLIKLIKVQKNKNVNIDENTDKDSPKLY